MNITISMVKPETARIGIHDNSALGVMYLLEMGGGFLHFNCIEVVSLGRFCFPPASSFAIVHLLFRCDSLPNDTLYSQNLSLSLFILAHVYTCLFCLGDMKAMSVYFILASSIGVMMSRDLHQST